MKRLSPGVLCVFISACNSAAPDAAEVPLANSRWRLSAEGVLINEFMAGAGGRVELFNSGATTVDLTGFSVDDVAGAGGQPKSLAAGTLLTPGAFLVMAYGAINTASSDSVRLLGPDGTELDAHDNFYRGSSTAGLCFGRSPDGGNWRVDGATCSLGASNGGPACVSGAPCDDGNACTVGEVLSAACVCGGGSAVSCDDGNVCTTDACGASGCTHTPVDDGMTCGDDQTCIAGSCLRKGCIAPKGSAPSLVRVGTGDVLLRGTVVLPERFFAGEVLVRGGVITCVDASCATAEGVAQASIVDTHGMILPGLIDTHNHVLFNIFDEQDWSPAHAYTNHDQWPREARYKALVDTKQYLNGEAGSPLDLGCELDKYGELKALVSGTTSVQGSANPSNRACYGSLARTIDQTPNGLTSDHVQTSTIFPNQKSADGVCTNLHDGDTDAYVIHIAEGLDATARSEFAKLGTITSESECLYAPMTTVVHGAALQEAELARMAQEHMSLVWSPRSNVFLYGNGTDLTKTANIPLALQKGINIALAPDWSIGGSVNLLDELRFADRVDNAVWNDVLSPQDLFRMVTINAARALALDGVLGSLAVGKRADLFVLSGDVAAPYDALLNARPSDVQLVMVDGVPLYGHPDLSALASRPEDCEQIDICCSQKFACVAKTGGPASAKLEQTYAQIVEALSSALTQYDGQNLTAWDFAPIAPLVRCE